jgi:deoxyhypusine synthase
MKECGVLGAGKIGRAAELAAEMFRDKDYIMFLTIAFPLIVASALENLEKIH